MLFWGWDPMVGPYGTLWWDSESRLDQGQRENGFYFSTFGLQSLQHKIRFSAGVVLNAFLGVGLEADVLGWGPELAAGRVVSELQKVA